jgi:hypothetical protein
VTSSIVGFGIQEVYCLVFWVLDTCYET